MDKKNVIRSFRNVVKKANTGAQKTAKESQTEPELIPAAICFHDLRHTHATGLISAGNSIKAVYRRLGQSTIAITLGVYGHLLPDDDAKLAGQADVLFG